MKYKAGSRRRAKEYEKAILDFWQKDGTFEKSVNQRDDADAYVFYDGPPFITGLPHHGTLLSSIVKDAVPRFWTMRGKKCERRWGWDCHGLPAENFVEKQLGITDRREIGTKWSLEEYITKARESMVANSETWKDTIFRIGRWVDFDGAYRTMDKDFMESVWWAFKTLYEAGKIYEGRKVLMYDTKFATPVSKAEVTMDNDAYQTVTDPSAFVKFKLAQASVSATSGDGSGQGADGGGHPTPTARSATASPAAKAAQSLKSADTDACYLIAWTTTPWTLPANMCLAVNPEFEYGVYAVEGEKFILAVERAKVILPGVEPEETFRGEDLVGVKYEPLIETALEEERKAETYTVLSAEFVGSEEGTGIVHCAPAYGEDDYALCQAHEVDFVDCIDENGYYLPEMSEKLHELGVRDTDENGIEIWAGNKFIAKILEERGVIWKIEYIQHEYPFNPRSKQRIMYRAFPSWFFDVQGSKPLMLEQNENVNWFPEYLKEGRFKKNIEAAPDWNLSRDRFWATAMPVWKGDKGSVKVVGSYAELYELSGVRLEDYHRPWVDEVEFDIDGEHFKRIEKVLDCWFESGSMPFAQLHYPFENKEKFEKNYPADFIVEYVGQVRAWFYYVHCVNTALAGIGAFQQQPSASSAGALLSRRTEQSTPSSDAPASSHTTTSEKPLQLNPFKNVITTGTLAGNDGRKMSKSLGNFTDPNELMDKYSADSLRFLLLSSPVLAGEDFALLDKDVSDAARKLSMIWNVYDFFCMYAEVDKIDSNVLGEWLSDAGFGLGQGASGCGHPTPTARKPLGEPQTNPAFAKSFSNPLDIFIISRVHQLRNQITEGMEAYNLPRALSGVLPFVDDLSNWFVRRSRRRFWKSEDDADKMEAYATLYYVLVYLSQILAPFTPFLSEELYQQMTGSGESVHLLNWPEAGEIDEQVIEEMRRTREIITEGLALRMRKSETEEQIKVRQPLAKLTYAGEKLPEFYEQIIREEVNVKGVAAGEETELDKTLTKELLAEGFVRELIRFVQSARKKAGLSVDDRIKLSVSCTLSPEQEEILAAETLASVIDDGNYGYDEIVKVNDKQITISLEKA